MEKSWYKSKSIWAGLALIVKAAVYDFWYMNDMSAATAGFFLGLGLIGLRQAIKDSA